MKDIEIRISKDTRMVELSQTTIGNDGENLQSKLVFTFEDDAFVDGQARLEYYANGEKYWTVAEKKENSYEVPILSVMTTEGRIDMQLVITEGTEQNEIPIFKSNMFYVYCNSSINAEIEQPEEYPDWIEAANTKLNQFDNLNVELKNAILTVTQKDGTRISENVQGPEGPAGPEGPQGIQGPQGVQGVPGEKGEKGSSGAIKFIPVNELPTTNIQEDAIYLLSSQNPEEQNVYDEYVYTNGNWERISGGASVNLDGYATEEYVDSKVSEPLYQAEIITSQSNIESQVKIGDSAEEKARWEALRPGLDDGSIQYIKVTSGNGKTFIYQYLGRYSGNYEFSCPYGEFDSSNSIVYSKILYINVRIVSNAVTSASYSNTKINPNNYLAKDNTKSYTPTGDYNPATKKYVDDQVGNINTVLATLTEVSE